MLSAEGIKVVLGRRCVLDAVDLQIGPGWTALVGPNGAGKSTLLRTLAGLQPLAAGRVALAGQPIQQLHATERARRLAWLAQQGDVTGELTVRETVALGRLPYLGLLGAPGAADDAAIASAMAQTECSDWQHSRLQELSGGERQRVLLARVLATQAPMLLLDEPTTHLDAPHQVALARLFLQLAHDARTPRALLTVLHDLPIALQADRVVLLQRGRVVAAGDPRDPQVQGALERLFEGAVRITMDSCGRPQVVLALDMP